MRKYSVFGGQTKEMRKLPLRKSLLRRRRCCYLFIYIYICSQYENGIHRKKNNKDISHVYMYISQYLLPIKQKNYSIIVINRFFRLQAIVNQITKFRSWHTHKRNPSRFSSIPFYLFTFMNQLWRREWKTKRTKNKINIRKERKKTVIIIRIKIWKN